MNLNIPKPFTPQANRVAKDWQLWKKEFMIYLKLSGAYEKCSEENRAYLLLNLMGTEAVKAMEKITFNHSNEKNDMDILIMKFDEIFNPPLNETEERNNFFKRKIKPNETIDNFVTDLKEKAETCNFGEQCDKFIMDMIVLNVDNYLREIIFSLSDVTIPDLIQYYKQYSANTDKIKEISKGLGNVESSDKKPQPRNCWRCDTRHAQRNCPAYGAICDVCNEKNHFSGRCKKESTTSKKTEITQKQMCSKCDTYHPFRQCLSESKKTEINQKRVCSKCGTNHPYQQCPAYHNTCSTCLMKGHYTNKCKNTPKDSVKKDEEQIKKTMDTKIKSTTKQNENKSLLDCLWCNSKHSQGQCQHYGNCTNCDKFPHNICFNCKKNPHESSCYFKSIITLPVLSSISSDLKTSLHTENKNHENSTNGNCTSSSYCNVCLKFGNHSTANCPRAFNNRPTTSFHSTNTADPLLKDYVKINETSPRTTYQGSASFQSNQTKPSYDYRNNSQSQKNQQKRNNPKQDNCCIA